MPLVCEGQGYVVRSGARLRLRSGVEHGARLPWTLAMGNATHRHGMTEPAPAQTFVGIDAHDEQCTICALNREGRVVWEGSVPTTKLHLRRAMKPLAGPVWVMVESSCNAFIISQYLSPVVEQVVASETRENRLISRSDSKSDQLDALRLAKLLRMGEYRPVHIPERERQEQREMVRSYQRAVGDVARAKNRIKRAFRRYGVQAIGRDVYDPDQRKEWLGKVSDHVAFAIGVQFELMDAALHAQEQLGRRLSTMLSKEKPYKLLKEIPGVGPIFTAIFISVIDDPHRFETKRKLWSYAGLGVRVRWSSDPGKAQQGGSRTGNRLLKYAAMMAATTAARGDNRFGKHYGEMIASGIKPMMARKTIARTILATAWSMWKTGSAYREEYQKPSGS